MELDTFDNPATDTNTNEASEVIDVSTKPPSFDELEAVSPVKEEKHIPDTNTAKPTPEGKQPAKGGKQKQEIASTSRELDNEPETKAEKIERKMLEAKWRLGEEDQNYQLPEDAMFSQKVDGEDIEVSLKDLRTNYSGKVAWDKRFSSLDKTRKSVEKREYEFTQDKEQLMTNLGKFKKLVDEDKHMDGLYELVDLAGGNRHNFYMGLRKQLLPDMEKYLEMTDEERAIHDGALENEMLKSQVRTHEDRQTQMEQHQHQVSEENRIRQSAKLSQEEYEGAKYQLTDMHRKGQFPDVESVTPRFICEYVQTKGNMEVLERTLATVDPELVKDDFFVGEVLQHMLDNPDTDPSEISRIAKTYSGVDEMKMNINKKSSEPKRARKSKQSAVMEDDSDGFFSDYDDGNMQTLHN